MTYYSTTAKREEIAGFLRGPGPNWVVGISETREYFAPPNQPLVPNLLVKLALVGLPLPGHSGGNFGRSHWGAP